jgi:transglutaminase-like putative cysteine protease
LRYPVVALVALVFILASLAMPAAQGAPPDRFSGPARYAFEYHVRLPGRAAGRLAVWIPYPVENEAQTVIGARVNSPLPWRLTTETTFGNRIAYFHGKAPASGEIVMTFVVERRPFHGIPAAAAAAGTPLDPKRYLAPDRLVPLDGPIRDLAIEQGKDRPTLAAKARAYYDYVYRTMTYKKEGTGWGRGDAVWACNARYGNCTDFHSLFIGMARSAGIPARFLIGFPIPAQGSEGPIPGYHCWAEWFDPAQGWVAIDASEAWKARTPDAYFGTLPNDRIEFSAGRDIVLEPPQHGAPLNYFIYPYAELDGKPLPDLQHSFRFRRLGGGAAS